MIDDSDASFLLLPRLIADSDASNQMPILFRSQLNLAQLKFSFPYSDRFEYDWRAHRTQEGRFGGVAVVRKPHHPRRRVNLQRGRKT